VQVDARQGDHWAQVDYLSSTGQVLSSPPPVLLPATGVNISGTGVVVAPAIIALNPSQTAQFTFKGTGSSNVAWSIIPALGFISSSGLYTAPAHITSSQTVLVRATSLIDDSKSATSTIILAPTQGPSIDSVSPNAGVGSRQSFSFVFSDGQGAINLTTAAIVFAPVLEAQNSCYAIYDRNTDTIRLDWDDITGYEIKPVDSSDMLQNSQCTIGASSATVANDSLTVTLDITFTGVFAGPKNIYMYGEDGDGSNTGWVQTGAYTVAPAPNP
jgi:hypothetical protein